MRQIIKCGSHFIENATKVYYKMRQLLYYKMGQFYYQSRELLKMPRFYYKIWRLSQMHFTPINEKKRQQKSTSNKCWICCQVDQERSPCTKLGQERNHWGAGAWVGVVGRARSASIIFSNWSSTWLGRKLVIALAFKY